MTRAEQSNDLPVTIARFQQLQLQLIDRWQTIEQFDRGDYDILVVPSLSLDQSELLKVAGSNHYEERLLFSLIHLRNPYNRVVYVTSQPLPPIIIDYYLQLLPGIPFSHARERLTLLAAYDASHRPLTEKMLERPRLLDRISHNLRPQKAHMICYNSTLLERELSVALDIPLWALDPQLLLLGTKSGSRQIFAQAQVPHPDGSELMKSTTDLAQAAAALWERQPQLQRMVVKLNEGFSGEGNAILDLEPLRGVDSAQRVESLINYFPHLRFQSPVENWTGFARRIPDIGAIVEAFIAGEEKQSPSVQGCISPLGEVEILSTHDQILGGADGQIYLGCSFPADAGYRLQLQKIGLRVGKILAEQGVLERFGVDFVAVKQPNGSWDLQAIEINLRKGGTTHPLMTLRLLTNGHFNLDDGLFYSQQGQPKYYVATDTLQKEQYKGLSPYDLIDIIVHHRLHFDSSTETGTVFHLIGCLSEFGKVGLTSIGNSPQEAQVIYDQVVQVLDRETSDLDLIGEF
jgi:PGM1 C-terminal domain